MPPANLRTWGRLAAVAVALLGGPLRAAVSVDPGRLALAADFPDPFLLAVTGGTLAYATNSEERRVNVQLAFSADLKAWKLLATDALPVLPRWAKTGYTWAPEVMAVGGRYALYFTARERASGLQCVGVATAASPLGPFASGARAPLVCQRELGGSIDPSPFRDADGRLFLLVKNDGNNPRANKPATLWSLPLSADGLSVGGPAAALLSNTEGWEGRVVEAPAMIRAGTRYLLLFSANDFGWQRWQPQSAYAMGYALCDGPAGPCRLGRHNPLLASQTTGPGGCLSGPGHQAVLPLGDRLVLAYHAWDATRGCRPASDRRLLHIGALHWDPDSPD